MPRMSDFDYVLPESAIAQSPAEPRDASRLLAVWEGRLEHRRFADFPDFLQAGDSLVMNDARVSAVRLIGERETGGKVEALVLRKTAEGLHEALCRPAKRLRAGCRLVFDAGIEAETVSVGPGGLRTLRFDGDPAVAGAIPLPPYIHSRTTPAERYQTVYAANDGSAAAPTAGLHFTAELLAKIVEKGVRIATVTLDVGIDTFRPVQTEKIEEHVMHGEDFLIPQETADLVAQTPGRVFAVGTTTVRALETAAMGKRALRPGRGTSTLFLTPGSKFQAVDAMLTNFHMPRTTMLLMVAAMCGKDRLMNAYSEALSNGYRFLSFGDAMLVGHHDR